MRRWLIAWALAIGLTSAASAQENVGGGNADPVRIRELLLPEDEILKWSGDRHVYQPMRRDEYERLVEGSLATNRPNPSPPQARIIEAHYRARVIDGDLRSGRAELELACEADRPVPLSLEPLSIAVAEARWNDAETPRPSVFGAGPDGSATLVVGPDDRRLQFGWSARGAQRQRGVHFSLRLPRAIVNSLTLDVPTGLRPVPSVGVVEGPLPSEAGYQIWVLLLGMHNELELSIIEQRDSQFPQPPVRAKVETEYDISESDVVIHSQVDLGGAGKSVATPLRFSLDQGVRVLDVRLGDTSVAWTGSATQGENEVRIDLPGTLPDMARITVGALAPIEQGVAWQLPRIRPQGVAWEGSTARVRIHHPLEIEQLQLDQCRITSTDRFVAPSDRGVSQGRQLEVQDFEPEANVRFVLGPLAGILQAKTAQNVRWSPDEYRLTCVTDWKLSAGRRFRVEYRLPEGWEVVAVETPDQPTRGRNWRVRDDSTGPDQVLEIELPRALSPESALHTLVRARCRATQAQPTSGPLPIPELIPLGAADHEGVIDFAVDGPYQARFERLEGLDAFEINQPGQVGDQWRGYLPERPAGVQFYFKNRRHEGAVRLVPTAASLEVRIEGLVSVGAGALVERYQFHVESEEADVDRLLVYFSTSANGPPEWVEPARGATPLRSRVLGSEAHASWSLPPEGELWEVQLPALSGPREVVGFIRSAIDSEATLSLPWPVGDSKPQARVQLQYESAPPWSYEADGVESSPATVRRDEFSVDSAPHVYQTLTYDRPDARIQLHRLAPEAVGGVPVVWQARLESLLAPGGPQTHRLSLQLERRAAETFSLTFPEGCRVRASWVDGERRAASPKGARLDLGLPRDSVLVEVVVEYDADSQPWTWLRPVSVGLPEIDAPVMEFDWRVAVPAGYELVGLPARLTILPPADVGKTWSQRLFGPLGRPLGARRFNPLASADWRSLFGPGDDTAETEALAQRIDDDIRLYADNAAPRETVELIDLLRFLVSPELALPAVLADAAALDEAGWTPQTPLPVVRHDRSAGPPSDGSPLSRAGLAVLVAPDGLVLTTDVERKRLENWVEALPIAGFYSVRPSPLAQRIHACVALARGEPERFQHVLDWAESAQKFSRSQVSSDGQNFAERSRGWQVVRLTGVGLPRMLKLRWLPKRSVTALAACLYLLAFAAAATIGRSSLRLRTVSVVALPVAAWSVALFVPGSVTPLFSAVALGALTGGLGGSLRSHRGARRLKPTTGRSTLSTVIRPAATAILVTALLWVSRGVGAQPAEGVSSSTSMRGGDQSGSSPQPPIEQRQDVPAGEPHYLILVPADALGQAEDRVYVPSELVNLLRRNRPAPPPAYVLTGGQYAGQMGRQDAQLSARIDLFAYEGQVPIAIPLPIDPEQLVPGASRLDGEPARPLPLAQGIQVNVAEPGLHRFEFSLRAPVHGSTERLQAHFRIPALPQASLRLSGPDPAVKLDVPDARGTVRHEGPGVVNAELGGIEDLVLGWSEPAPAKADARAALRYEMLWDVQPGSVSLRARFHYRKVEGELRRLYWLLDSPMELKRVSPASLVQNASIESLGDDRRLLTLELAGPLARDFDLEAEFVLGNSSGIGNLWLPRLVPQGVRQEEALLAIRGSSQIVARVIQSEGVTAISAKEFLDRWGGGVSDATPELAFRMDPGGASVALATRPPAPSKTVRERLVVRARRDRLDLVLEADVLTERAPSFQHRFRVSPELRIDEVSVAEGEFGRLDHWSRDPQTGETTLFLTQPALGTQRVRIACWYPTPPAGEFELPRLGSAEGQLASGRLVVISSEEHDLVVDRIDHLQPVAGEADDGDVEDGWVAARFDFDAREYSAQIKLTPNVVEIHSIQTLAISQRGNGWGLAADLLYRVDRGRVYRFAIRLPANLAWDRRNVVAPDLKTVTVESDADGRLLSLVPNQSIEGEYRVRLEGMIAAGVESASAVPHIETDGVGWSEQYLVVAPSDPLVGALDDNPSIERANLPAAMVDATEPRTSQSVFRVLRPGWRVLLPTRQSAIEAAASVFSADVVAALDAHGKVWGEAEYAVFTSAGATLELAWPNGARLCGVEVDGRRVGVDGPGDDTLAIDLPSAVLPQRVVARWQQPLPGRLSPLGWVEIEAPMPKGLSVGRTWWTVRGPNGFQQIEGGSERSVSALGLDLERLETTLLELHRFTQSSPSGTNEPSQRTWLQPWLSRFDREVAQIRPRLLGAASAGSVPARSHLNRLDELVAEQRQLLQRIGVPEDPSSQDAMAATRGLAKRRLESPTGPVLSFSQFGRAVSTIGFWSVRTTLVRGALGGVVVAAMVVAAWIACRVSRLPLSPRQQRLRNTLVGGGIGLAWWWWLQPSAVGLVVVAASLLAFGGAAWHARRRNDDSVVVIVSR